MKFKLLFWVAVLTQVPSTYAEEDEWSKVLQVIKEQRTTIKTGQFSGIGISESFIEREKTTMKGVLKLRVYFDFPGKKIRYEREAPAFSLPDYKASSGGIFIRTAEKSIRRDSGSNEVYVGKPDGLFSEDLQPFDLRALGLAFYHDYHTGTSIEKILSNYSMFKDNQLSRDEKGLVTVVTTMSPATRRTLVIDTTRGYWPTRLVVEGRGRDSDGKLYWRAPPEVISEVSAEQIKGIWLPVNFSVSTPHRKDSFKLKWNMVNENHNPALFTPEGLDLTQQ